MNAGSFAVLVFGSAQYWIVYASVPISMFPSPMTYGCLGELLEAVHWQAALETWTWNDCGLLCAMPAAGMLKGVDGSVKVHWRPDCVI